MRPPLLGLILLPFVFAAEEAGPPAIVAHDLAVTLHPDTGGLEATDTMTVRRSAEGGEVAFDLRADLKILALSVDGKSDDSIAREPGAPRPGIARYRVRIPRGPGATGTIALSWSGTIREEVAKAKDLAFVAGDSSRGTISPGGVFLSDSTGWVPLGRDMAVFKVSAKVPEGWTVVTQGLLPADGLWLQAGRWKVERRTVAGGIAIATFLSEGNAGLSKVLLDAVVEDLARYQKVLGPYPHEKFDIVENFFSTGYGMPSATLLGGDVLRHVGAMASRTGKVPAGYLDHELVHGWWGNGVFVDYGSGNWCEALTSYCTNYLKKEWESAEEGAKHRRGTRARFAARVRPEKDYALRRFTGKTEDFENDIGYGKGSMLFHGVRRAVGDEAFFGALRDLAAGFAGKRASWNDLRAAFEKRSGRNLEDFLNAGLDRTGAPVLALAGCAAAPQAGGGWTVTGKVVHRGAPWPVAVPVVVETVTVDAAGAETPFSLKSSNLPLRVLLDPESECWRGYGPGEAPAMLDSALRDGAGLDCILSTPNAALSYGPVVEALRGQGAAICTPKEDGSGFDREPAPSGGRSTIVVGHLTPGGILEETLRLFRPLVRVDGASISVGSARFEGDDLSLLASLRHPRDPARTITVYGGMSDGALAAARRVFFYGGDGVVVFKAGRPVLRLEPEGDESSRAPLLATALPGAVPERAKSLVDALCTPEMAGRLAGTPAGAAAVEALAVALRADGLEARVLPFSFPVTDWDGAPCLGVGGGKDTPAKEAGVEGIPFCFSPPVPDWRPFVPCPVEAGTTIEALLSRVQAAQEEGAKGVLVIGPETPPPALAGYLQHPSRLTDAERAKAPVPALSVAGKRSRLLAPGFEVTIPVVYLGQEKGRSWLPSQVRSPVTRTAVETANLVAVIPGSDPDLAGEAVLLGAHHDHLGPGYAGANDDASGVAAVREAARVLLAAKGSLRRSVVIALFGAEEWGLQGSREFTERPPQGLPRVVAALTLDTVGQKGVGEVHVVGTSVYPALGALAARCLGGAGLAVGRDIDKFAFAWGSDHYSFHRAGVPAVDLFSAEYRIMHTTADVPDTVDPGKVADLARAAAAFALRISREGLPK